MLRTTGFSSKRSLTLRKPRTLTKFPSTPKPKPPRAKKPKRSITKLKKDLDRIFSIYIRQRDTNAAGLVVCYTCKREMEFNKSQNGHFVPRQYLATRWDEVNCHAQCYACNMLYNGQPSAYAARLKKDYGPDMVELLESKRTLLVKDFPYEYWIPVYQEKISV
jgi:hypothetical protein